MKTFKISSPAYKANGFNGTYYSIAICDDNNLVTRIIGDHSDSITVGSNLMDFAGQSFSDEDRVIVITAVNADISVINLWQKEYAEYQHENSKWWDLRATKFGSVYDFIYGKKGKKDIAKEVEYEIWLKDNPAPKAVHYYDFLKSI